MNKYYWLATGIIIGWITKFPLVLKWYKELKKTNDYKRMKDKISFKEMVDKYNKMYPEKEYKIKKNTLVNK